MADPVKDGLSATLMNGNLLVGSTTDPAFATDRDGVIRAWNAAAEEAFGLTQGEAQGRQCSRVLKGLDVYGNEYCSESCPLRQMALSGRPVHRCQIHFRDASGETNPYSVNTLLLRGLPPVDPAVVHLLQRVYCEVPRSKPRRRRYASNHNRGELSPRELEVLRLLADGHDTKDVARTLCISHSTARNHIQHVLHKLHVHSRLEAVAAPRKAGLI